MGGHEDRRTLATWQIISIWWNHRFWWTHSAFNQRIYQPINKYSSWPFYVCVNAIAGHTISSGADAALVAINAFYIPFSAISTQFGIRLRNEWCKRNNKDEKKKLHWIHKRNWLLRNSTSLFFGATTCVCVGWAQICSLSLARPAVPFHTITSKLARARI